MPPDVRKRSALPSTGSTNLGLTPDKLGVARNSIPNLPEGTALSLKECLGKAGPGCVGVGCNQSQQPTPYTQHPNPSCKSKALKNFMHRESESMQRWLILKFFAGAFQAANRSN